MYSLPAMDLKKFLKTPTKLTSKSRWLKQPGFKHLFVRHGRRYFQGTWYDNVLDIANVEARTPGKGTFTKFLKNIQEQYPEMIIYVECVQSPRFGAWLERQGFQWNNSTAGYGFPSEDVVPKSYYLLPKKTS